MNDANQGLSEFSTYFRSERRAMMTTLDKVSLVLTGEKKNLM